MYGLKIFYSIFKWITFLMPRVINWNENPELNNIIENVYWIKQEVKNSIQSGFNKNIHDNFNNKKSFYISKCLTIKFLKSIKKKFNESVSKHWKTEQLLCWGTKC